MASDKHELVQLDELPVFIKVHQHPGSSEVPPHWHQSIELSFTLKGKIDHFIIGGVDYQTQPGEILIINTQVVHSVRNLNSTKNDLALTLLFPYSLVLQMFPEMDHYQFEVKPVEELSVEQATQYHHLQTLLSKIIATKLAPAATFKNLDLTILSYEVLKILLKYFLKPRDNKCQISRNLIITGHLRNALDYIQDHYQEPITPQDIANSCHLSRQYLQRVFHQNMGTTIGKYLKNFRAQKAYQNLRHTANTLTAIAMNNGFSGIRSLNRAMVDYYGQTSMQIRKSSLAPYSSY